MAQQALQPGNDADARPGPLRAARRERLGLGVAEGRLLVRPPDLHARLHPGPGLLLHGQPDDRPRDPRLELRSTSARETNQSLPCPAPVGAVVPWQPSPPEIALPAPRTDGAVVQSGTTLLYIGGSDGKTARTPRSSRRSRAPATSTSGPTGPNLPEPRSDAGVVYSGGKIYVVGGVGADGKPTTTTYVLTPGRADRRARRVADVRARRSSTSTLPEAAGGRRARRRHRRALPHRRHGRHAARRTRSGSRRSTRPASRASGPLQPGQLFTPVTDASAAIVGSVRVGLRRDDGATATATGDRPARRVRGHRARRPRLVQFGVANGRVNLPAPRTTSTASPRTATSTRSAAPTARRRSGRSTGASRRATATSPSGSTSSTSDLPRDGQRRRRAADPRAERDRHRRHDDEGRHRRRACARTSRRRSRSSSSASSARRSRR